MSALEPIEGNYRRKAIRASAAPSDSERRILTERRDDLDRWLSPANHDEVTRSIASLRAVLPAAPGTEASAKLAIAAYVTVLEQFPIWAINQVCRKYLDGSLSSGGFAPSPPQMAQACRSALGRFHEELATLDAILSAEVYGDPTPDSLGRSAEAQAAIDEAARSRVVDYWHNEVRPTLQPKAAQPKESPEATLERLRQANAASQVVIGGELEKKLAGMRGEG